MPTIHLSASHVAPTDVRVIPGEDAPATTMLLVFNREASAFWREEVIFPFTIEEAAQLARYIRDAFAGGLEFVVDPGRLGAGRDDASS